MFLPTNCGLNHSFISAVICATWKKRLLKRLGMKPAASKAFNCHTRTSLLRLSATQYCQAHSLRKDNHSATTWSLTFSIKAWKSEVRAVTTNTGSPKSVTCWYRATKQLLRKRRSRAQMPGGTARMRAAKTMCWFSLRQAMARDAAFAAACGLPGKPSTYRRSHPWSPCSGPKASSLRSFCKMLCASAMACLCWKIRSVRETRSRPIAMGHKTGDGVWGVPQKRA
mmetsp:Transcript_14864/g.40916  ORF Transcript_14864/g.40916 Transcript_14864/m.40916 type:complete len:225 (-) Transcript_14864:12-686(-)